MCFNKKNIWTNWPFFSIAESPINEIYSYRPTSTIFVTYITYLKRHHHNLKQHLIVNIKLRFEMAVTQLRARYGMEELKTINKLMIHIVWVIHSLTFRLIWWNCALCTVLCEIIMQGNSRMHINCIISYKTFYFNRDSQIVRIRNAISIAQAYGSVRNDSVVCWCAYCH